MKIPTVVRCSECDRVFDLLDDDDAYEWYYGHDCELEPQSENLWEHPSLGDWQYQVHNGDTLRGFREWLLHEGGE